MGEDRKFVPIEVNQTVWTVPSRYNSLAVAGHGSYGTVSYVIDGILVKVLNGFDGVKSASGHKLTELDYTDDIVSAKDTELNLEVAIKKLDRPFDNAEYAKRTYRELAILSHMDHENVSVQASAIVRVFFIRDYISAFKYNAVLVSTTTTSAMQSVLSFV
ncbi:unnamed protein product [Dibothriocephalus latus]|uniref:Protein kinase domain-containing protein n=1 Tax=Dibothriocephalus latus TaxID=60516 RepID=A0A3P6TII9_DIBLA|nr:unnamed protein product [Dibothriocephalus latus]